MPEVVIPSESNSPPTNNLMSSFGYDSSSEDTEAISPTLMSHQSVLPEFQVLPRVDLVDLVSEDEEEELEEDTSFEEDPSMDEDDPFTESEFMDESY